MQKLPHIPLRRAALLAAVGATFAAPAVASAAPDFTPATTSDNHISQRVAFGNGEETAVHYELLSQSPVDTRVVVTTRRAGATPTEQLVIPSSGDFLPSTPQIAVAPNGAAALAWQEVNVKDPANPTRYRAAYRTPAGVWEAPVTIASDPGLPTENGVVAIGNDGTAVVVFSHAEADSPGEKVHDNRIDASVHGPSGGWDGPTLLSTPDRSATAAHAGVDAAGNITVTYGERYQESPDRDTAMLRRRPASNGVWTSAVDLTQSAPAHTATGPALAVAPDGRAALVLQSNQQGPPHAFAAVRESASGSFGQLVKVGPEDAVSTEADDVAIAPDGTAYVAYRVQAGSSLNDHIGLVRAVPGGNFTPPQRISPPGIGFTTVRIAFSGNDAVTGWSTPLAGKVVVQAARWQAGSPSADAFQDLETPTAGTSLEDVQSDGEGGVEIVWSHNSLTTRTAAFDAGAPVAGDASVPASAVAGEAVPMKASFADRWSPLAPGPEWDFGDGSSGSGSELSHAYAQPGDYTVKVRSADVLGNARERTFGVHVTAAAPSQPAPPAAPAPKVKLKAPKCGRKLSAKACRRFLHKRSTWKVLRGTASGAARVQVTIKRAGSKRAKVVTAKLAGGKWVAKTGALKTGKTTFTVRAFGVDGAKSAAVAKKVRLR
jgi:hypothetical protein